MTNKQIGICVASAVAAFLIVALACHGAGANAHGFVVLPLGAGTGVGLFVRSYFKRSCR